MTNRFGLQARLNHVAITMSPTDLSPDREAEIISFYGDVFGWYEHRTSEPGNPFVLAFGDYSQFLYLLAGEPALSAPKLDHFGVQVATLDELDGILERARCRQRDDDRVVVIDRKTEPQPFRLGTMMLTNCYVGFLLPLLIEVQHLELQRTSP